MALSLIDNSTQIEHLAASLDEITENLVTMETPDLVDTFVAAAPMAKAVKKLEDTAKTELRARREEGGADDKGHRYLTGSGDRGVKIEQRVSISLTEDAPQKLADKGVLDLLPRSPNPEKMMTKLRELGVDPKEYTDPVVTQEGVEGLYTQGLIDAEFVQSIVTKKPTYAVKQHKAKK